IARRAASISRAVMRARLVALRPNSPKDTLLPRVAKPALRPLNCLRYLVRLGCSMRLLPRHQACAGASPAGLAGGAEAAGAGVAGAGAAGAAVAGAAGAAAACSPSADTFSRSALSNTSPLKIQTLTPITP